MSKYFTKRGIEYLQRRINEKELKRSEIGAAVGEAAGDNCDWHDNAPFDAARDTFELASADIRRLRADIHDAVIIEIREQAEKVAIGSAVTVLVDGKDEKTYVIGAAHESSPEKGLITYNSPVASALLRKEVGDIAEVELSKKKKMELEIIAILPPSAKYKQLIDEIYPFPSGGKKYQNNL
ncbi:GreA/GreB family elongation factor [Candidatus Peregrinibacteria bacterium]|nr:GreA/GreB family elongation factor [Candidatus Peregrinibacteria bacterium]